SDIRAIPAEIGGGFGGKTLVYLEPLAVALSRKAGKSVKMQMTREEVFRGSGPTSGATVEVKIGAKKDGTIVAAKQVLKYQAGAFAGSPIGPGCMCGFAMYDLPNIDVVGYDVVSNRPKVAAYRAPGAPITSFAVESLLDDLALKLGIDPLTLREKNAAKNGTKTHYGPTHQNIGFTAVLDAVKSHPHWKTPLKPGQGRGLAAGFWFNIGGESSASVHVNEDGSVTAATGSPDIGGSRASIGMMVAEALGVSAERVRTTVADTASIGFTHVTGGSRVTFATGMAATQAAEKVVEDLKRRAAQTWEIPVEAVEWKDGKAYPAGSNAGAFEPLDLATLALKAARTGGPIQAEVSVNAQGAGAGFGAHICDVSVDKETGQVTIERYTAIQDVGKAIHPSYVEGQIQGGAAQGIGWALNEEYIYNDKGQLENPGFLDYRCPVASDVPMIEAVLVEVPNPRHPFGARGADRSADGGGRQRHPQRDRPQDAGSADVAAQGARRPRRGGLTSKLHAEGRSLLGLRRPAIYRWPDGVRGGGDHLPPTRPGTRTAISRPRSAGGREHGGGDRRRDLPGRLCGRTEAGQRGRTDPEDRRGLIGPISVGPRAIPGLSWRRSEPVRRGTQCRQDSLTKRLVPAATQYWPCTRWTLSRGLGSHQAGARTRSGKTSPEAIDALHTCNAAVSPAQGQRRGVACL